MLKFFEDLKLDIKQKEFFDKNIYTLVKSALSIKGVRTLTQDEFFSVWSLIKKNKPRVFLELGGQQGHSGIVFANAVKSYGGTFITVELGDDVTNKYPIESVGTLQFLPDDDPNIVKIWGDCCKLLPRILDKYKVDMVFHDADHTYESVEGCVKTILDYNPKITQICHDCKTGMWQPEKLTKYGYICAERPVFDKYFMNNPDYYYHVIEDGYGAGFAIPVEQL